MLQVEIMQPINDSISSDSSFYSNESFYSDEDDFYYGMGGMYADVLQHAPPSREDYNGDPSRDRTAICLGKLILPVKASRATAPRACLTGWIQYLLQRFALLLLCSTACSCPEIAFEHKPHSLPPTRTALAS
jgi:hypothetical protein